MRDPQTLYIEVTNRCNLFCTTCPRTFFRHEQLGDLSFHQFKHIVEQVPSANRVVLHGLGEPLLHPDIVRMVSFLKRRNNTVLFNTNGQLLASELGAALVEAGLDELRVSIDMPDPKLYGSARRGGQLAVVYANVEAINQEKARLGKTTPEVSFWMTEGKQRLSHLPQLVRDAARLNVTEVYLQRLILMDRGEATEAQAVFGLVTPELQGHLDQAQDTARKLGVNLWGSGDTNPATRNTDETRRPWSKCRRPFEATYVTANGNILPCCLSPFTAAARIQECVLGNIFDTSFDKIWTGPVYSEFRNAFDSDSPPICCAQCGTSWSL